MRKGVNVQRCKSGIYFAIFILLLNFLRQFLRRIIQFLRSFFAQELTRLALSTARKNGRTTKKHDPITKLRK